jgi:hypothetical protein
MVVVELVDYDFADELAGRGCRWELLGMGAKDAVCHRQKPCN